MAVAIFLFLGAFFAVVLAQDKKAVPQDPKIKEVKDSFKSVFDESAWWAAYLAVRTGDDSAITKLKKPQDKQAAQEHVALLIFIKSLAQGEPRNLPGEYSDFRDLCIALKSNDPTGLSGYKLNLYNGLIKDDKSLISIAFSDSAFPFPIPAERKKEISELFLNVYNGYKTGAPTLFSPDVRLIIQLSTEVLFSKQPPQAIIDALATDVANFNLSREQHSSSLCSLVKNAKIRSLCQDPSVKNLNDLFTKIF